MFKKSFLYSIEALSPKLISVILLPILLRLINPTLWAEITILLALQLFISYFLTHGDENSILKYTADKNLIAQTCLSLIKYSTLVLIFFEIVALLVSKLPFSIIYGLPFRFMFLSTVFISLNKLFLSKLKSLGRAEVVFKSTIFESLFINLMQLVAIALTVQIDGYNTRVVVTIYFLVQLLGNFFKLVYLAKNIEFKLSLFSKNFFLKKPKNFLSFSNLSFFLLLTSYFLNWQDKFFVEYIFGLSNLGIYSVASRIGNLGMVFIVAILVSANAKYWPKDNTDEISASIFIITKDIIKISLFAFTSLSLIASTIGKYIIPKTYHESVDLIYLASFLIFLHTIVLIFSIDFGRLNQIKKVVIYNTTVFITQILIYNIYEFSSLEEVYLMQIFTLLIFIPMYFYKTIYKYRNILFLSIIFFTVVIVSIFTYITFEYQVIQIFLFLSGCYVAFLSLQQWLVLDS